MKNLFTLLLFALLLSACNKISLDRLEGTWEVAEIEEIPTDNSDIWENWLDTVEVKVGFFADNTEKVFYFEGSTLVGFEGGTYTLLEDEAQLVINDTSLLFNSHGEPLDIISLKRNKMTLEGKYYLHGLDGAIPTDSFKILRWTLEQ